MSSIFKLSHGALGVGGPQHRSEERPFRKGNRLTDILRRRLRRRNKKGGSTVRDSLDSSFDYVDMNINEAMV
jgi:hypothetical protein